MLHQMVIWQICRYDDAVSTKKWKMVMESMCKVKICCDFVRQVPIILLNCFTNWNRESFSTNTNRQSRNSSLSCRREREQKSQPETSCNECCRDVNDRRCRSSYQHHYTRYDSWRSDGPNDSARITDNGSGPASRD